MDVLDRLKAAGVENVGIVTEAARAVTRMTETVTDIIVARRAAPDGLQRDGRVVDRRRTSLLVAFIVFMPASWRVDRRSAARR